MGDEQTKEDSLLDRIYEAAAVPELWRPVLGEIAEATDSRFGCLVALGPAGLRWIGTEEADALIGRYAAMPSPPPNLRLTRGFQHHTAGFLQDLDVFTLAEMEADPFYREVLYPAGYGWCAGTFIELPDGERLLINVERARERGPIEPETIRRLDRMRPHLARAALLASRIGLERARATTDALEAVGLPAAVLGARGRVRAANPRLHAMMPAAVQDRRDRIALSDRRADALLAQALGSLGRVHDRATGLVRSVPVAGGDAHPPMILHLVPVRLAAHDVLAGAEAVLIVTPVEARPLADVEPLLQVLFDLTPAEARVARGIGSARTIDDIALDAGVSRETVRNQLKAVLAKTGTARQAELAALLAGARLPSGEAPAVSVEAAGRSSR